MNLQPRLIAPHFVTPYRMEGKGGKNDATDAAAICGLVLWPTPEIQGNFAPATPHRRSNTLPRLCPCEIGAGQGVSSRSN